MLLVTVSSTPPAAPLRRDAERNRARILQAAQELFAERGLAVTLDDIADHAGVGVGTVYRRFANREALIDALFDDKLAEVLEIARIANEHPDAWDGLVMWITGICELFAVDRGLKAVMLTSPQGQERAARARGEIMPLVQALLARAQADGELRDDVTVTDIPLLEFMVTSAAEYSRGTSPELWRRYLAILLDGLRATGPGSSALPVPALGVEQLDAAMRDWR